MEHEPTFFQHLKVLNVATIYRGAAALHRWSGMPPRFCRADGVHSIVVALLDTDHRLGRVHNSKGNHYDDQHRGGVEHALAGDPLSGLLPPSEQVMARQIAKSRCPRWDLKSVRSVWPC